MPKSYSSYAVISTTGAGIAIGTGAIQFGGFIRGSELAGSIIIKDSASVLFTHSAMSSLVLNTPIRLAGPVTMTSSAGDHFVVFYRDI